MKASPYNYSTSMPDGTKLLFNFFTLTLLALKPSEFGVVEKILKSDDHARRQESGPEFRTLLEQKGFLVPDGVDELAQLKR